MFSTANLLLINKADLVEATDSDVDEATRRVRALTPELEVIVVSCRTGAGLEGWLDWIEARIDRWWPAGYRLQVQFSALPAPCETPTRSAPGGMPSDLISSITDHFDREEKRT